MGAKSHISILPLSTSLVSLGGARGRRHYATMPRTARALLVSVTVSHPLPTIAIFIELVESLHRVHWKLQPVGHIPKISSGNSQFAMEISIVQKVSKSSIMIYNDFNGQWHDYIQLR